jgi:hypothetical protein
LFLEDVGATERGTWVVVLDDNGESVFDLALFQRLLLADSGMRLVLLVNSFPVSTNFSSQALRALLDDPYFLPLRGELANGRVRVLEESQAFRAFEANLLSSQARECVAGARGVYVKGQAFFETFQPVEARRYYCFCVSSRTSALLTGCRIGQGVFARVDEGRSGFKLDQPGSFMTLRDGHGGA